MEIVLRVALVALAAALLVVVADRIQTRSRSGARTALPAGVALVVTPACTLCDRVRNRLAQLGVEYAEVASDDSRLGSLVVRSAPALLCVGDGGEIHSIRTGRAAVERLHDVVDCTTHPSQGAAS